MTGPASSPPPHAAASIETPAEAETLCRDIEATMRALSELIERETALVRKAEIARTAELEERKSELARRYVDEMKQVRAHRDHLVALAPDAMARLRDLNTTFHSELQINLAALATARAVAEDLVRGVSEAVGRKRRLATYSRQGRVEKPTGPGGTAITVDRSM